MAQSKPLILAVDDEVDVLQLFQRVLEPAGYEVITASDGAQALALVSARNPDLMLLDIKLPKKSGMEVLEELRSSKLDTAIIMATGVGDVTTAIKAMRIGAFDYLTKPFSVEEILISVERALERRKLILENQDYRLNLEKKVAEQTQQLQQKVRELTALNNLFVTHLNQRYETEESYSRLANSVVKLLEEMQALAKEALAQKERMKSSPLLEELKKEDNP